MTKIFEFEISVLSILFQLNVFQILLESNLFLARHVCILTCIQKKWVRFQPKIFTLIENALPERERHPRHYSSFTTQF